MAYADFTLESAESELGIRVRPGVLFRGLQPSPVPGWLREFLERGRKVPLMNEKTRSEFIVAPILLALRELSGDRITILSGQSLNVDPVRRLVGECDFLLTLSDALPLVRAPLLTVVEAKRDDIESALGQCAAQMVAVQVFNERAGQPMPAVYGCVTTGENWQFLRLEGTTLTLDQGRFYVVNVGDILAAFQATIPPARAA